MDYANPTPYSKNPRARRRERVWRESIRQSNSSQGAYIGRTAVHWTCFTRNSRTEPEFTDRKFRFNRFELFYSGWSRAEWASRARQGVKGFPRSTQGVKGFRRSTHRIHHASGSIKSPHPPSRGSLALLSALLYLFYYVVLGRSTSLLIGSRAGLSAEFTPKHAPDDGHAVHSPRDRTRVWRQ